MALSAALVASGCGATSGVFAHGDGVPAQFRNYTSNGGFVERGEPTRQERIVNGRESR
jgi:hypothetical protein